MGKVEPILVSKEKSLINLSKMSKMTDYTVKDTKFNPQISIAD
jgi:hypothetical protein